MKIIKINDYLIITIKLRSTIIEQVKESCYLGSVITNVNKEKRYKKNRYKQGKLSLAR